MLSMWILLEYVTLILLIKEYKILKFLLITNWPYGRLLNNTIAIFPNILLLIKIETNKHFSVFW